jgi:DNA-binding PadR family transcriptional regulator
MRGFETPDDEAAFGPGRGFGGAGADYAGRGFGGPDLGPGFHGRPEFHGGPPGFGPRGRGYGRRGGGRAKRGDVRAAALALLAEGPMNGYQIIQQITERSGSLWRPSPGSVYPALAQLEDEALIALQDSAGGRRAYALTEAGRTYVAEHPDELRAPWSAMTGDAASASDMRTLLRQVHLAAFQVVGAGSDAQLSQARKVLAQTRRALYRILAEDDEAADDQAAGTEPGE